MPRRKKAETGGPYFITGGDGKTHEARYDLPLPSEEPDAPMPDSRDNPLRGYPVRRIKRDKPNSGLAARGSNELTGRRHSQADTRGKEVSAQIIRLVPKAHNPFEAWLSALRDYQLHWLRLWSSWMPR